MIRKIDFTDMLFRRPTDHAMHRLARGGAIAGLGAVLCLFGFMLAAASVREQELKPRSYTNAPVGLNFLIAGYGYAEQQPLVVHPRVGNFQGVGFMDGGIRSRRHVLHR